MPSRCAGSVTARARFGTLSWDSIGWADLALWGHHELVTCPSEVTQPGEFSSIVVAAVGVLNHHPADFTWLPKG